MAKEYCAHSLPGRQRCKKFKLFQRFKQFKRFERLEQRFMEECGGNGEGVCGEFWRGGVGILGGIVTGV
jgi:hypothetical protein